MQVSVLHDQTLMVACSGELPLQTMCGAAQLWSAAVAWERGG